MVAREGGEINIGRAGTLNPKHLVADMGLHKTTSKDFQQ